MTRPTVAVVIPVRDGAGEIAGCVEAVLAQTARPDELVVVDNGSTDGTAAVAAAAGATVVHERRPGSYAARNTGVAATTADIVVFTDVDCIPEPHWLEALVTAFDDPDVGVAGGPVNPVQAAESAAERWAAERGVLDQATAFRHPFMPYFATANAAYRRSVLVAVGGFDAQLASGGDVDASWRVQVMTGYRLHFVPGAVVRHRHRVGVRPLLRQQLRYARGHGSLDTRWGDHPAYRSAAGRPSQRLRAAWLLPARIPARVLRRRPLSVPLIDAAVRILHEVGRSQGRRLNPLNPLHPAGAVHQPDLHLPTSAAHSVASVS